MKTQEQIKSQLETETGLKFTIAKGYGSMKHYTIFSAKSVNGQRPEVDFQYGRNFVTTIYPNAFFSNLYRFSIPTNQIRK